MTTGMVKGTQALVSNRPVSKSWLHPNSVNLGKIFNFSEPHL